MGRTVAGAALSHSATAVLAGAGAALAAAARVEFGGFGLKFGLGRHGSSPVVRGALIRCGRMLYDLRTMVRNQTKNSDTIGGLAGAAGVGVETVRYYQRRGLLAEPARPHGEVRRYGESDVKRLRFIRSAQAAGFTLNEIKELLDLDASDDRARARELAKSRVVAIDAQIAHLREARDALDALATACAKKRGGLCPILKAFDPK
jgi:MerR family mercuric resistance operon transcriptional regulator